RARLADAHIEVLTGEPIGTIAPEIYGHFAEHLGGVVYDGSWVGEDSKIPNVGGIRKALVDALKPIRPGVVRWPGGCFADAYDWRDGVGPREKRPRRTNFWADDRSIRDLGNIPARFDPNRFGTNEFMRFCRLVGAQPYLAANVRTLPAKAFFEWVEYCNSPAGSTTLAELRAAGGDREPFGARFWGIGNESWGCGGNFTPEEYAGEFRRFATWSVPDYGVGLRFVASGPNGNDRGWTRRFFEKVAERNELARLWGWAVHHYSSSPDGEAVKYSDRAWYELLTSASFMETLIQNHWEVMGEFDRRHRVKLVVDEWGAWHKMTTNVAPEHLFGQQSTIRDALVAGLTLDTFNRHADKVAMANIAQLVNCIQSLFLADGDRFLVTPTYHVFAMYGAHQGATSVRTLVSAPAAAWTDKDGNAQQLPGLDGSASVRDRVLTLTVTNRHPARPVETEIAIRGAGVRSIKATTLAAPDIRACNTFEHPRVVAPSTRSVPASGASLVYTFPAASVTALEIPLGASA
ncbi:MAG TPA: alpha-L-arabinofuranosidase C-terminal domain-containing protein, partial [Longimicrobiales bacterium]|nr:alpha-L-arabinofuranosidase C-terminal domain-containing protein [Longimicrobiales bacterium]